MPSDILQTSSEVSKEELDIVEIPSDNILITECSATKNFLDETFGLPTRKQVRNGILNILENSKDSIETIPPIIVLSPPGGLFQSKEQTKKIFLEVLKRQEGDTEYIDYYLELIYKGLKEGKQYVCYNGNTRLEAFQKKGCNIKTHIIASGNDLNNIPETERLNPGKLGDLYGSYELCYVHLLLNAYSPQVSEKRINDYFLKK